MTSKTQPNSAPKGWQSGISSLAFDLDEDESDPEDDTQDARSTSGMSKPGNKAQEKTFERSLMQEASPIDLDLESRHDPARPPPNLLAAPNKNKKRKAAPAGENTNTNTKKINITVPASHSNSTAGQGWQMSLPFVPVRKGPQSSFTTTAAKDKDVLGPGEPGTSEGGSGSSEGAKKRKTLGLGPNHNTTGTRKTSIQQKISSFGVPRPEPSRRDPPMSSTAAKNQKGESKHFGAKKDEQGGTGAGVKKVEGGGGIRFGTLPNLKVPAAQKYPIVMGFEKQKTLPVKPPPAILPSRSTQMIIEPYPESRARSEDDVVCLGETQTTRSLMEVGERGSRMNRPSGSQKLQQFKLDAGRMEGITEMADEEWGSVDLCAEEYQDDDIPLADQADDYGFQEHVSNRCDPPEGNIDDKATYHKDQSAGLGQHRPDPDTSRRYAPVYAQTNSPNVNCSSGPVGRDLEPEDFYGAETSYEKSSFACPSNKRHSLFTNAYPTTPRRTFRDHRQLLQEVPSDRSAVPAEIIARRAFQAARVKGEDQKVYGGERPADGTDELASTWSTLPSRQTIKTKPRVPVKTAAKFSLPNGLFGKSRQPNPMLFSGPSSVSSQPMTTKYRAPTRAEAVQLPPARKITMFHPTPRPDISIGSASSPTPSPSVNPRPLHRSYTNQATLAEISSEEQPLTTPLTSVLLQPAYLDPLETSRLCVDLRDLARDYRIYRLAIGASHRIYTPPPLVRPTSQESPTNDQQGEGSPAVL